jgi:DNA ligase-1
MTNPITFTKPMLAVDADMSKVSYPIMCFPKIDGVRGMVRDGKLLGRSLKQHKNLYANHCFGRIQLDGLDGELAIAGQSRSASLCRDTTSAVNRIKEQPDLTFHCFDYLTPETVNCSYLERYGYLRNVVERLPCSVQLIPYVLCFTEEAVMALYAQYIEEGYEGVVLRDPEAIHKNGRSTRTQAGYLRIKPTGDAEGIVVGFDEAMTNNNEQTLNELGQHVRSSHKANKVGSGKIGALWLEPIEGGERFKIGAGCMTHEDREYYFRYPGLLKGKIAKYKFFDHGAKDALRHGRFFCFRAESDMEQ